MFLFSKVDSQNTPKTAISAIARKLQSSDVIVPTAGSNITPPESQSGCREAAARAANSDAMPLMPEAEQNAAHARAM